MSRPLFIAASVALGASPLFAADTVTNPFYGVEYIHRVETSPRPLLIDILKIDLNAPGLTFKLSDTDPNPPVINGVPDENITQTTRDYVGEIGAQRAINASFFRLENSGQARWTNNVGIAVSNGHMYSPWDSNGQEGINIGPNNVATIVTPAASRPTGYEIAQVGVTLHNAVYGSDYIVANNVNTAPARDLNPGAFLNLNPRTAIGYTNDNRLIMATIDGRQTGVSEGMYLDEVADLLIGLGAKEGLNLDGGGSTTMVLDYYSDGQGPRVVNSAMGRGTPGSERYNGTSLGAYAIAPAPAAPPAPSGVKLIDEFERGYGHFSADMTFSGSTRGVNAASRATMTSSTSQRGLWSQQISIVADQDATPGFLLRHVSSTGRPVANEQMGTAGYVGFFLRTTTPGLEASIGIDENLATNPVNMEQGTFRSIIADGQWHLYEWNLADALQWESYSNGNGTINGPITTIDSIFIRGATNANALVDFDTVAYNPNGSLAVFVPEPSLTAGLIAIGMFGRSRARRVNSSTVSSSAIRRAL